MQDATGSEEEDLSRARESTPGSEPPANDPLGVTTNKSNASAKRNTESGRGVPAFLYFPMQGESILSWGEQSHESDLQT